MARIEDTLAAMGGMEMLATQRTQVHNLDPRAKLVTTLAFIVSVVSFGKYEIASLSPLLLYPVFLALAGNIPITFLLSRLLIAAPFAVLVGISNPVLDHAPLLRLGTLEISGGWVSYVSILFRFVLTVSAALLLVATTGFNAVCRALVQLGVPRMFAVQLMLLYRYVFVLAQEALRTMRAWRLRSVSGNKMPLRVYLSVTGQLLVRAVERSQRIHMAMLSRGFTGEIHLAHSFHAHRTDLLFVLVWGAFFGVARLVNVPQWFGRLLLGVWG